MTDSRVTEFEQDQEYALNTDLIDAILVAVEAGHQGRLISRTGH